VIHAWKPIRPACAGRTASSFVSSPTVVSSIVAAAITCSRVTRLLWRFLRAVSYAANIGFSFWAVT